MAGYAVIRDLQENYILAILYDVMGIYSVLSKIGTEGQTAVSQGQTPTTLLDLLQIECDFLWWGRNSG